METKERWETSATPASGEHSESARKFPEHWETALEFVKHFRDELPQADRSFHDLMVLFISLLKS
jgi:hypothetical protein